MPSVLIFTQPRGGATQATGSLPLIEWGTPTTPSLCKINNSLTALHMWPCLCKPASMIAKQRHYNIPEMVGTIALWCAKLCANQITQITSKNPAHQNAKSWEERPSDAVTQNWPTMVPTRVGLSKRAYALPDKPEINESGSPPPSHIECKRKQVKLPGPIECHQMINNHGETVKTRRNNLRVYSFTRDQIPNVLEERNGHEIIVIPNQNLT